MNESVPDPMSDVETLTPEPTNPPRRPSAYPESVAGGRTMISTTGSAITPSVHDVALGTGSG